MPYPPTSDVQHRDRGISAAHRERGRCWFPNPGGKSLPFLSPNGCSIPTTTRSPSLRPPESNSVVRPSEIPVWTIREARSPLSLSLQIAFDGSVPGSSLVGLPPCLLGTCPRPPDDSPHPSGRKSESRIRNLQGLVFLCHDDRHIGRHAGFEP